MGEQEMTVLKRWMVEIDDSSVDVKEEEQCFPPSGVWWRDKFVDNHAMLMALSLLIAVDVQRSC